ncbi:hypothetical protein CEK62_13770 [Alcanivorax sp. N3-2A]|nr:hypothetical protein CEK62_13770 [Alcanivorax sp. N3-2A]|tara:strand:- start:21202 stop:21903 length:702 start_codon:yes stop_codon:yes gene_type:complete
MKIVIVAGYGLLVFGVFSLIGSGVSALNTSRFLDTAVSASGTVTELVSKRDDDNGLMYSPRVHFRDGEGNSVRFVPNMSSNPPAYSVGEGVRVLYAPGHSEQARLNGFFSLWGASSITGGLGVLLVLVGAGLVLWPRWKAREVAWLKRNGQRIAARAAGVELDRSLSINGRHPYRIVCQWSDPASGEPYRFTSEALWFDPSGMLGEAPLAVWIDPQEPRRYYVDLSFLPAAAR